jgi:hypothetical protein
LILSTLNIKYPISEIISISNLQFSYQSIENTNIITHIPKKLYNIGFLNSVLIGLIIGKLWLYFDKSSIGKLYINKFNFYILKYINRRILDISLFWKLFLLFFLIFILVDIYQIYYYNSFINFNSNLVKIILNMAENSNNPILDGSNSVVNVQTPICNVNIPV